MRHQILAALLLTAAPACDRQAPQNVEPPLRAEITALDQFGPLAAPITGLAFWAHPAISFNGMALASTADGVIALNIEDGAEVARLDGFDAGGVAVVYADPGADARGLAIIHDADAAAFRVYEIDNQTRSFSEIGEAFAAPKVQSFCAGPAADGALQLVVLSGRQATMLPITDGRIASPTQPARRLPADPVGCTIDQNRGQLFVLLADGRILRDQDRNTFSKTSATAPVAIAFASNAPTDDASDAQCCGQILILDRTDASLHVLDAGAATLLGAVTLKSSFDIAGVAAASAFSVGSGNFGGAYRDGVIAMATTAPQPQLRLAPFNAVMNALAAPLGQPRDQRTATPLNSDAQTDEDEAGDFSIDFPMPPQP